MSELSPQFRSNMASAFLVALIPLTLVYMPRPPVEGSQYLMFPLAGLVGLILIALMFPAVKKVEGRTYFYALALCLLLLNVFQGISMMSFVKEMRTNAVMELMRPFLVFLFLVTGIYASQLGPSAIRRGLVMAAIFILIGQAVLVAGQYLNVGIVDLLYNPAKFDESGRITGSMQNPNGFAWIIAQMVIIPIYFYRSLWKWTLLPLAIALILMSGSRSQFLLFPFMVFGGYLVIRDRKIGFKTILTVVIGCAAIGFCLIQFLRLFKEQLPYMWELYKLVDSKSLSSIGSFAARLEIWADSWNFFSRHPSEWKWLIGLGPQPEFRTLDNEYYYVFYKYGVIGSLIHFASVFVLFRLFLNCRNLPLRALGLQYLVVSLVMGVQSETLSGWFPPLLLYFYAGLALQNHKPEAISDEFPSKIFIESESQAKTTEVQYGSN